MYIYIYTQWKGIEKSHFRQYGQMEKAEVGRVREEKKKREDQRRERVRRKKMQVRKKVGKSRLSVFSH